jgi:hypothetical protein
MRIVTNRYALLSLPLLVSAVLSGCASVPAAPTVMVLPGAHKSFSEFQNDSLICQQYASAQVAPAGTAAQNDAVNSAVVGTAVGAAAGALIGSASGQPGSGAAIGAGSGLLVGSAAGSNGVYGSSYQMQRSYDIAYMQCMYAKGNQIPGQVAARQSPTATYPPAYPPPNTPPPAGVVPYP